MLPSSFPGQPPLPAPAFPCPEWPTLTAAERQQVHDRDADRRAIAAYRPEHLSRDPDGTYRWDTNHSTTPTDLMARWVRLGLVTREDAEATARTRAAETAALFASYRANARPLSGEALAEARAAFGRGTEIVNVITGVRTLL